MFHVQLTDQFFYDSPEAGDPACICSRCNKAIPEDQGPVIRARPTEPDDYGYDPSTGGTEFRYCNSCCEKMGVKTHSKY